jgi:hypothetical protein
MSDAPRLHRAPQSSASRMVEAVDASSMALEVAQRAQSLVLIHFAESMGADLVVVMLTVTRALGQGMICVPSMVEVSLGLLNAYIIISTYTRYYRSKVRIRWRMHQERDWCNTPLLSSRGWKTLSG